MQQAPAQTWNRIAETQTLQTAWAQQMFPLPEPDLEKALLSEESKLTAETGSSRVAIAFLLVAPLLWERAAIAAYQDETDEMSLPIVETVQEAVMLASKEYALTMDQQKSLNDLLLTPRQ